MIEEVGDLFTYSVNYGDSDKYVARVIPTNGMVSTTGKAIMGRGVALQAATKYKTLPTILGSLILSKGNRVHELPLEGGPIFVSFPTKYHWREPADLKLIERSAQELISLLNERNYDMVIMPKPGTGNGNLNWSKVKPVLESVFKNDTRITILTLW